MKCYCKKSFNDIDDDYYFIENVFPIFEKGKIYTYEIENDYYNGVNINDVWVIFNEDGEDPNRGRRFCNDKVKDKSKKYFNDYFENERLTKLKKLNEIH